MADDLKDDEVLDTDGEGDNPADQDTPPDELPDDPATLKQMLLESKKENGQLHNEVKRQETRAKEFEVGKTHWYNEWDKVRRSATPEPGDSVKNPSGKAKADETDIEQALEGMEDLATLVADDKGAVKLAKTIVEKIVNPMVERKIEERVKSERSTSQAASRQYREVVSEFPDIENESSELYREASSKLEQLVEQNPGADQGLLFRLAVEQSARKIGYEKPKGDLPAPSNKRLATAQGGPKGGRQGAPAKTAEPTPREIQAGSQMGLSTDAIKKAKANVAQRQQQYRSQA